MERPAILTRVLNDLYYLFRYENNSNVAKALSIVLDAMDLRSTYKFQEGQFTTFELDCDVGVVFVNFHFVFAVLRCSI